jgi:hypothetical protein
LQVVAGILFHDQRTVVFSRCRLTDNQLSA